MSQEIASTVNTLPAQDRAGLRRALDAPTRSSRRRSYTCHGGPYMWTLASMEMRREVDEPGGGGGAGPASRGGEWRGVARDGEGPHLAAAAARRRAREGGRRGRGVEGKRQEPQDAK
jgi:hypothetical protein